MELGPGNSLHTPLVLSADPRWGGWKLDLGYRRPAPLAQTPYAHRCKPEFARSGPHTPILHALCAAGMIPKPMGQGPGRLVRAGVAFRSVPTVRLRPRNASWGAALCCRERPRPRFSKSGLVISPYAMGLHPGRTSPCRFNGLTRRPRQTLARQAKLRAHTPNERVHELHLG